MMNKDKKVELGHELSQRKMDIEYLIRELQVHQIELEMQNEELKRAILETEAAFRSYSTLYNSAPIGYFTLDLHGKITKVNTAGTMLLGINKASLYKKQFQYFIDRDSLDDFNAFLTRVYQTNEKQKCRIMLRNQQGIPIETYVDGVATIVENESEIKILLAFTDISEISRIEDELREAQISDQLKTEFFANVSHEFRTPLNVIFTTLQIMDLYKEDEKQTIDTVTLYKYMGMIKQNSRRLLRLVNNLIDVTRIDAGFFEPVFINQDITKIVKKITLSVTQYVESKELTLNFQEDAGHSILACDSQLIERVMLNLLSNAIKFTKPGGSIVVRVYSKHDKFFISVKDTGIGIPRDKMEFIFQRYRQVDNTMTRENEGSGIGLYLVQTIIQMHKGFITVTSEYGKGTDFVIELPIRTLNEDANHNKTIYKQEGDSTIERIKIEFSDIYF